MDKYRLVMPPTLFTALATPFWSVAHGIIFWNWHAAVAAFCGGVFGYTCYDMTHYFLHHQKYVCFLFLLIPADVTKATFLLPAAQEVSSEAPLRRLPKRLWCHKPFLGLGIWHRTRDGPYQGHQD